MLALDRSHTARAGSPPSHQPSPTSSSSVSRPSAGGAGAAGSRRTASHSGALAADLPPRSRSTPPVLPHSNSFTGTNAYHQQQQQQQQQQQIQHQWQVQQQQRQQFGGGAGWNPYGAGGGAAQQHQQWTQQAMAGLSSQQFFHHQQQQLAAWASAYQQQLMRSGSSPPVPFPGGSGAGPNSPYGHASDFAPPAHMQDPSRRRSTSGPQQPLQQQQHGQHQRSPTVDRSSYFPSATVGGAGPGAAHYRHNSFTATPHRPYTPPPPAPSAPAHQQKSQQQQQRQPSPPSSDPSTAAGAGANGLPPQGGFHPYRRPERKPVPTTGPSSSATASARDSPTPAASGSDLGLPARPYARAADGARSDSSVNSRSSASRQAATAAPPTSSAGQGKPRSTAAAAVSAADHARGHSLSSSSASGGSISSLKAVAAHQHQPPSARSSQRAESASQRSSAAPSVAGDRSVSASPAPSTTAGGADGRKQPAKPSPLSQSQAQNEPSRPPTTTVGKPAASAAAAAVAPAAAAAAGPEKAKKGFMGKLKGKGKDGAAEPGSKANPLIRNVSGPAASPSTAAGADAPSPDAASFAAVTDDGAGGKRGGLKRTRSLFNMKNASTDNISIASAASSASMMIRKIGSFGKLASRNSISGISNIFKDKKSKDMDDVDAFAPEKKKGLSAFRSRKAAAPAPLVSRASAELDREAAAGAQGGLTPAARLARQHTIKSRAAEEAEERRRTAVATAAAVAVVPTEDGRRPSLEMPSAWESTTASSRSATVAPPVHVDDGFSDSEDDQSFDGSVEDVAGRLVGVDFDDADASGEYADWGRHPVLPPPVAPRSILKQHSSYGSAVDLARPEPTWTRMRSNSSDQSISATALGPNVLNDLQPDANQIDGVHSPEAVTPAAVDDDAAPTLPPLFSPTDDPFAASVPLDLAAPTVDRVTFPYQNPAHNSSAPTLSLFSGPPAFTHRSVTAPPGKRKEIAWAPNCAVYHTFHATEYDRRSEPATCNRLTPALAQEIKLFLNHYKMEEMEIHPASKAHTHFFP